MKKIALIGDTHFARKAEHPLIKKYIKEGQLNYFTELVATLKSHDVDTILFTGDIHDTRHSINVEALVNTKRLFQDTFADFDIHIILGNHDMYAENDYNVTSLELFEDIPNVTVYRDKVTKANWFGKEWYLFPWIIDKNIDKTTGFLEKLAKRPKEKRDNTVLFGHFEMLGIEMEGNSISTFGMDTNLFLNAAGLSLSGHYHGLSETTKGDSTVLYLGSPYPMTFANANAQHGIWLLDENLEYEFLPNKVSPMFMDIWDTDDIDRIRDLSNCFVRFYSSNDLSKEEEFELRLKIEKKSPILIRPMPYKGSKEENEKKDETLREANRILAMDTVNLSEIYIDQNIDSLPELTLYDDAKAEVLNRINTYKETINA